MKQSYKDPDEKIFGSLVIEKCVNRIVVDVYRIKMRSSNDL